MLNIFRATVRRPLAYLLNAFAGLMVAMLPQSFLPALRSRYLGRFVIARSETRLQREPFPYTDLPTRFGAVMAGSTEDLIQRRIYQFGIWEPELTHWVEHHLEPGDVMLDIGANVGYYTLLGSSLVGDRGHVFSFEPAPSILDQLSANLASNRSTNVSLQPVALGETNGVIPLFRASADNIGRTSVIAHSTLAPAGEVMCRRACEVIPPEFWSRITLVKIDVEGAELSVLRGLEPVLEAMGPGSSLLVELSAAPDTETSTQDSELVQFLVALGFDVQVLPNEYNERSYIKSARGVRGPLPATFSGQLDLGCVKSAGAHRMGPDAGPQGGGDTRAG